MCTTSVQCYPRKRLTLTLDQQVKQLTYAATGDCVSAILGSAANFLDESRLRDERRYVGRKGQRGTRIHVCRALGEAEVLQSPTKMEVGI